jgi:DnaJ-class molecular chaperone
MKSLEHWTAQNYYERLQLERDASAADVKRAYHELARIYHPDSNYYSELLEGAPATDPEKDEEIFRLITQAYNCLVSKKDRERYDLSLPDALDTWDGSKESETKVVEKKVEVKVQSWTGPQKKKAKQNSSKIRINVVDRERIRKSVEPKKIRSVSEMIEEQRMDAKQPRRNSLSPQVASVDAGGRGKYGLFISIALAWITILSLGAYFYMKASA